MNTTLKFSANGTFCNEWGTIDEKGIVYMGRYPQYGLNSKDAVGCIDSNGYVYSCTSAQAGLGSANLEGCVDPGSGNVFTMLSSGAKHYVGCMDAEGYVRIGSNILGRVDPATDRRGAAAIILLLKKQAPKKAEAVKVEPKQSAERTAATKAAPTGGGGLSAIVFIGMFVAALLRTWIFPVIGIIAVILSLLINACKGRRFDRSAITFKAFLGCAGFGLITYIVAIILTMITCGITGAGSRGVGAALDNEYLMLIMGILNAISMLIWKGYNTKTA